jgi:hypothetical protein
MRDDRAASIDDRPPHVTMVRHEETIVRRVETTVPCHQVYRLLRVVDREGWLRKAIARIDDPIACMREAIARSAHPVVRSSRRICIERTTRTRVLRVVPRERTIRRIESRIAPREWLTRPHQWTIVHDSSTIVTDDELIGRPARRIVLRANMIRHDGRRHRSRVEVEATRSSRRLHRAEN